MLKHVTSRLANAAIVSGTLSWVLKAAYVGEQRVINRTGRMRSGLMAYHVMQRVCQS